MTLKSSPLKASHKKKPAKASDITIVNIDFTGLFDVFSMS
ncbi:protein of unknown function [Chryseobacterium sp. JV274]|nr:protein of unknown function [Chryseobacterium sp. JV274]